MNDFLSVINNLSSSSKPGFKQDLLLVYHAKVTSEVDVWSLFSHKSVNKNALGAIHFFVEISLGTVFKCNLFDLGVQVLKEKPSLIQILNVERLQL